MTKPWRMAFWLACIVGAVLIQRGCGEKQSALDAQVEQCAMRGVKHFMDVGAYPKLSDGRIPYDVARERCVRTLTAF